MVKLHVTMVKSHVTMVELYVTMIDHGHNTGVYVTTFLMLQLARVLCADDLVLHTRVKMVSLLTVYNCARPLIL